jgi:hypothetical protein
MSLDPRDRAVERLLRAGDRTGALSAECLDAETAAAWADGGLAPPAVARAEAHVANCARCQAVLAALVRVPADDAAAAPHAVRGGRSWWQIDVRWLVPLAGAATAALLWMVVPRHPAAPAAATEEKAESSIAVPATPEQLADEPQQSVAASEQSRAAQPAARSDRATASAERRAARESQKRDQLSQRSAADRLAKTAPSNARTDAGATVPAEPPPPGGARNEQFAKPNAPAPPAAAGLSADAQMAPSRLASEVPPLSIVSAAASVAWRVGADGVVERSVDRGATWAPTDKVPGTPLAGASPSASVCWLVGRGGLVVISTDGRTWRLLPAPGADDLVAVEAADERSATVRTAAGASFQTTDGGVTWRRLP